MNEKLMYFLSAIEAQSWAEVEAMAESVAADHEEKTEHLRTRAAQEAESYRQAELSGIAQSGRLSQDARRAENRRSLLELRTACETEAMDAVREKVRAYTASGEYPGQLAALFTRALDALGIAAGGTAVVYLRREDLALSDRLKKQAESISLTAREGDFALGGLIVEAPEQGRRADLSFDTALRAARDSFGEIFDMEI